MENIAARIGPIQQMVGSLIAPRRPAGPVRPSNNSASGGLAAHDSSVLTQDELHAGSTADIPPASKRCTGQETVSSGVHAALIIPSRYSHTHMVVETTASQVTKRG